VAGVSKSFLKRLTAAGTAPVFHRIPYYSELVQTNFGTISRGKSKDYSILNAKLSDFFSKIDYF